MHDDTRPNHQERLQQKSHSAKAGHAAASLGKEAEAEAPEASCNAFGYLRGIRDHSAAVELRFRSGNSIWFPYSWLGNWQYNPSDGLLLKFSGDLVYLVLIRGSNIDRPLNEFLLRKPPDRLSRGRDCIKKTHPYPYGNIV